MIEPIQNLPSDVLGFRASGRVTGEDYESVIVPAVNEALKANRRIRLLYQIAPDFEGFDPHALWEDSKVGLRHPMAWDRIAFVTDLGWLRRATRALGFTMPAELRVFENRAFDEARAWISARPA
jgi:hypothetical protein